MKTRYTDEQLSMLLGEHARLGLVRGGMPNWTTGQGCAVQVMMNENYCLAAMALDPDLATAFDHDYDPRMSPAELLALVAKADRERAR